jgi:hypothetical protein
MYASFLGISGSLHLDVFEQPANMDFSSTLLEKGWKRSKAVWSATGRIPASVSSGLQQPFIKIGG